MEVWESLDDCAHSDLLRACDDVYEAMHDDADPVGPTALDTSAISAEEIDFALASELVGTGTGAAAIETPVAGSPQRQPRPAYEEGVSGGGGGNDVNQSSPFLRPCVRHTPGSPADSASKIPRSRKASAVLLDPQRRRELEAAVALENLEALAASPDIDIDENGQ
jgi:hypothetical protein